MLDYQPTVQSLSVLHKAQSRHVNPLSRAEALARKVPCQCWSIHVTTDAVRADSLFTLWPPHSSTWRWQVWNELQHLLNGEVKIFAEDGHQLSIQNVFHSMA